jgi:hypothetical protein
VQKSTKSVFGPQKVMHKWIKFIEKARFGISGQSRDGLAVQKLQAAGELTFAGENDLMYRGVFRR